MPLAGKSRGPALVPAYFPYLTGTCEPFAPGSPAFSQGRGIGQLLAQPADVLPRIPIEAGQALHHVEHRVLVAGRGAAKLLPGYRHRDWRAGPGPRRIGRNGRLLERIAQIIDEDLPRARRLGHLGEVALGVVRRHRQRERLHEGLGGVPFGRFDRRHHVQSLAARQLDEAFEIDRLEPPTHVLRGRDDLGPADALARIEVEDDPVAAAEIVDHRAAYMHLQHAGLHQREHPVDALDRDDLPTLGIGHGAQIVLAQSGRGVLLEEALTRRAFRAAHQRQRASDHLRRHPVPYVAIIVGEVLLGDTGVDPINAVRMGETHIGVIPRLRLAGGTRRRARRSALGVGGLAAGTLAAGTLDAGTLDAGTLDAGTLDAGTLGTALDFGRG